MLDQAEIVEIQSLIDQGRINKAEVLIAQCLRRTELDIHQRGQLLAKRARIFLLTARPDRALDDLAEISRNAPDLFATPHIQRIIADSYFAKFELASVGFAENQDVRVAQTIYDTIMRLHPSYEEISWVHYQLGRILLIFDRVDQATEHFLHILSNTKTPRLLQSYCYERLAFISFYSHHDPRRALEYLEHITFETIANDNLEWTIQVYLLKGRIYLSLNLMLETKQMLEHALSLATKSKGNNILPDTLLTIAEHLSLIMGNDADIIKYLHQYTLMTKIPIGVNVTWSKVYQLMGDAYVNLTQYEDAILSYNSVLQFNPYSPWKTSIVYRIAKCYYMSGNYVRTINTLKELLNDTSSKSDETNHDYQLFDLLGSAYFALGNYTEAGNAFGRALQSAPQGTKFLEKVKLYHHFSQQLVN